MTSKTTQTIAPTDQIRTPHYVWPDDTVQSADDGAPYAWKSDDFLTVSLTEEQAATLTYDEMIQAMTMGSST